MGKRNVASYKQVNLRDSFKDPVLDKIQKYLVESIKKQDRILQRSKRKLNQKKQSSFTQRQNLMLEDALRYVVSYHRLDWPNYLPTIEYAHATLVSSSSILSPFQLSTGREINDVIATGAEVPNSPPSSMSNVEFAQMLALE